MNNYLTQYALKNIWQSPEQDLQVIVKPARITHRYGVFTSTRVLWRDVKLPIKHKRFHLFQIGQLHPLIMGLFPSYQKWKSLAANCRDETMITNVYTVNGVHLPLETTFYMVTSDKNLIIAVMEPEEDTIVVDPGVEDIYFRVYTNAYFNSLRSLQDRRHIDVISKHVQSPSEISKLQNDLEKFKNKPGAVLAYINGYLTYPINLTSVKPNDYVECVYDSSIRHIVDWKVSELGNFNSTLDKKRKFLLTLDENKYSAPTILYFDDVDFYILQHRGKGERDIANNYKGAYLHRNAECTIRQVTHSAYSADVQTYHSILRGNKDFYDQNEEKYIKAFIRYSGFERPLVFEANRIHELYKGMWLRQYDNKKLERLMLGLDGTIDEWRAETLEASMYTFIMGLRENIREVTLERVEDALGYNAITKVALDTPLKVENISRQKAIRVPFGFTKRSTGFEYDKNGLLLGWHLHREQIIYPCRSDKAELVEFIPNYHDNLLDEHYGNSREKIIEPNVDYRFYKCQLYNGEPDNKWVDITDTGEYVAEVGKPLVWLLQSHEYGMVRSNKIGLAYDFTLKPQSGIYKFSITHFTYRNEEKVKQVMQVPMGDLDIFLNGRSLIPGIDYHFNFPEVVIINKRFLNYTQNNEQQITVRYNGFATDRQNDNDISIDIGYVDHGRLSDNNRFDIRDDKVTRIVVAGSLYHPSELKYDESDPAVIGVNELNGSPYLIRDLILPLRDLTKKNTKTLRDKARDTDKRISDIYTKIYPSIDTDTPNVIDKKYPIYSPFIMAIAEDLRTGALTDERIIKMDRDYSRNTMDEILVNYLPLLAFDAIHIDNAVDPRYVEIHPSSLNHVVELNAYQYRFLELTVKHYCRGLVKLSHFFTISSF